MNTHLKKDAWVIVAFAGPVRKFLTHFEIACHIEQTTLHRLSDHVSLAIPLTFFQADTLVQLLRSLFPELQWFFSKVDSELERLGA